jgi:hypothetical protein
MKVRGHIDVNNGEVVAGWVIDDDAPTRPLTLELMNGGDVIATGVANVFREDLVAAGIGNGRHGFYFPQPAVVPRSALRGLAVRIGGTPLYVGSPPPPSKAEAAPSAKTLSRFGGLWIDREDWLDELALRHRTGRLSDELSESIFRFVRDGYHILPGAVSQQVVEACIADVERLWQNPPERLLIESWEENKCQLITARADYRYGKTKLCDVYAFSDPIRQAIAAPRVMEFLRAIFDDKPKAFQGLHFSKGSEQAIHKDSAYVKVDTAPMHLAASWTALEDVRPGTGELLYFVGSHRAPEYLFAGHNKWVEINQSEDTRFVASLHEDMVKYKQKLGSFLAKTGDVLIWHADLAHGGSPIQHPGATRNSQVTHFTTKSDEPWYRRTKHHRELETDVCAFVSNYSDIEP